MISGLKIDSSQHCCSLGHMYNSHIHVDHCMRLCIWITPCSTSVCRHAYGMQSCKGVVPRAGGGGGGVARLPYLPFLNVI